MTQVRFLSNSEVSQTLSMSAAIDALERGWMEGLPVAPPRQHVSFASGDLLMMPAHSDDGVGVKLVTVAPGNPQMGLPLIGGVYVMFDAVSLVPDMIVEAAALTALRTAAVSGVAARHLAVQDASRLVVFGAGVQARSHIEAMRAVREINEVIVVGRSPDRARALADDVGGQTGGPEAVADADIVCCCTTSPEPLFDGSLVKQGAHVIAVGSYDDRRRELDPEVMRRAARVVVEDIPLAMSEAGDVVMAIVDGAITEQDLEDLSDVLSSRRPRDPSDITVFKSVGMAAEDLVIARAIRDALEPGPQ